MRRFKILLGTLAAVTVSFGAQATVVDTSITVGAQANSTTGGVGADPGVSVAVGDQVEISVANPATIWSAGPNSASCTRDSTADGIPPAACGGAQHTQGGLTANFGALVARIGAGNFIDIGIAETFTASAAGALTLWYFDSNSGDNSGTQLANIRVTSADMIGIPEPASLLLLAGGLAAFGAARRRR